MNNITSKFTHVVKVNTFKAYNIGKQKYDCPVCKYYGPFRDINPPTGFRKNVFCPNCYSAERHRLQKLVLDKLIESNDFPHKKMLHFAPEPFFQDLFRNTFKEYVTVDLYMENVDVKADIINLPFQDEEFDFIFASHVLEHIQDDFTALSEIKRVIKPTGIAVLPVPILSNETIEYPEPNPFEADHVRAPGFDYYERYINYFQHIEKYSSKDFSEKYQPFIYEDRTTWPTKECPLRQPMVGEKHLEIVPVCYA
ncbi:class I SAM-dependent methyltransferase [Aliterella atlantica]|uniref:class I SAM-dependent methyltransferase n=1 Tax=Aliterella atlantica TaxID=1827278 RepID=UPI0005D2EA2B|nr:class I SAM-dependent methyltransferase [Aliterella atlantica]